MMKKRIAIFIGFLSLVTVLAMPLPGHAVTAQGGNPFQGTGVIEDIGTVILTPNTQTQQGNVGKYTPIVSVPGLNADDSLPGFIKMLFKFSIVGGGILAVIFIIIGGFQYMVSGAGEGKKGGKDRIQNAIIGLLLLLLSYLILYVINPDIISRLDPFESGLRPTQKQQPKTADLQALREEYAQRCGGISSQAREPSCTNLELRIMALEKQQQNVSAGDQPQGPAGSSNSAGNEVTPALSAQWTSEIDSMSSSELKTLNGSTCTNPNSPFYQGEVKCQYIQNRIQTLEEASQGSSVSTIGKPAGGWNAWEQYKTKQDVETAAAACRADGRAPYTFGSALGGQSCKETLFGPYVTRVDAGGTVVNPKAYIDCGYRFSCKP